jgi:hypothetical protein
MVARTLLGVANFYEKALFVKVDVATALWLTQLLLRPSRYASICTLRELTLLVARCIMGSVLIRATKEALQSSERPSSWKVGQVRWRSGPLDPKRSGKSRGHQPL